MIGWRLDLEVEFPEGLAPGALRERSRLRIARNGMGELVLRGTSFAGVLKSELAQELKRGKVADGEATRMLEWWFGYTRKGKGEQVDREGRSRLVVEDVVPTAQPASRKPAEPAASAGAKALHGVHVADRTFHARDRHTGSVLEKSLFSVETWPPGATASVRLWFDPLRMPEDEVPTNDSSRSEATPEVDPDGEARLFLGRLIGLLRRGIRCGGNRSRGIGRMIVRNAKLARYDVCELEELGRWLDDRLASAAGTPLSPAADPEAVGVEVRTSEADQMTIDLRLGVPRGQDFVVADGNGEEADLEPQVVTDAKGRNLWRLPGATLKGAFRSWTHHLAVGEGKRVADSRDIYDPARHPLTGNDLGWCFDPPKESPNACRKVPGGVGRDCPVADLFGSLHRESRLHISDGYAPIQGNQEQHRAHVAIDAITGGAVERLFFDNFVISDPWASDSHNRLQFPVRIEVNAPTEDDIRWIAKCLGALHTGLIRVGSSRAAGRLEVVAPVLARGERTDLLQQHLAVYGIGVEGGAGA